MTKVFNLNSGDERVDKKILYDQKKSNRPVT